MISDFFFQLFIFVCRIRWFRQKRTSSYSLTSFTEILSSFPIPENSIRKDLAPPIPSKGMPTPTFHSQRVST